MTIIYHRSQYPNHQLVIDPKDAPTRNRVVYDDWTKVEVTDTLLIITLEYKTKFTQEDQVQIIHRERNTLFGWSFKQLED